jgi:hypothetical protein
MSFGATRSSTGLPLTWENVAHNVENSIPRRLCFDKTSLLRHGWLAFSILNLVIPSPCS